MSQQNLSSFIWSVADLLRGFLQDEVEFDIHSGFWMIQNVPQDQLRGGNLKWLCGLFDYRYLLQVSLVLVSEPTPESENQVAKMKGVKQIVILGYVDEDVLRREAIPVSRKALAAGFWLGNRSPTIPAASAKAAQVQ